VIRPARPQDVDGIAAVHASAWQAAYPGILPASVLQAFTVANRRKYWAGVRLDDSARDRPVFVAVEDNSVVGFAVCGPPRDRDMNFDAELYVLNVDPGHWRRGVGRRLFAHCIDHLATRDMAASICGSSPRMSAPAASTTAWEGSRWRIAVATPTSTASAFPKSRMSGHRCPSAPATIA
jgi:ribosomal protein S18 acetylase RimI-like enzyme